MFKIYRTKKEGNFIQVDKALMQDLRLSAKARCIMAIIIGFPDNWDFSLAGLAKVSGEGIYSIRSAMTELEKNGYLARNQLKGQGNRFGDCIYEFYEVPLTEVPHTEKPHTEQPLAEKPHTENHIQSIDNIKSRINNNKNQSIKTKGGIDEITHVDDIARFVADILNEDADTYRIKGEEVPKEQVHTRLGTLTDGQIAQVSHNLAQNVGKVNNWRGYLLACLYNAASDNRWQRDAPANHKRGKTKFHNYEGRKWDYDYLELMEKAYNCKYIGKDEEAEKWYKKAEELKKSRAAT